MKSWIDGRQSEGGLFALMSGLLPDITDVIVVVIFGGWMHKMQDHFPKT